jgi:hypothetical protein
MTRQQALRALFVGVTAAGLCTALAACTKSEEKAPVEATKPAAEAPAAAAPAAPGTPTPPTPAPEQKPET